MNVPDPTPPVIVPGLILPPLHERLMREGKCWFREVRIPIHVNFRKPWATNKRQWLERGFSLRLQNDVWTLQQWLLRTPTGYALTQVGRDRLAECGTAQGTLNLQAGPAPRQLVLPDLPSGLEAKLRGYQIEPAKQIFRALSKGKEEWGYPGAVDFSDMGTGKAQPVDWPVLTPTGWRPIGNLQPGDFVISQDGRPTRVTGVFPQGLLQTFNVRFTDGRVVQCCRNHLWRVQTATQRARKKPGVVKPTYELAQDLYASNGHKWSVPLVQPVEFAPVFETLPLHPYLLGYLIGNGCFRAGTPRVSIPDQETVERLRGMLPAGITLRHLRGIDYSIASHDGNNTVTHALERLELMGRLSHQKRIPAGYMRASIEDRLALLQGILDSDGSASGASADYSTASELLAEDVRELAECLGGLASASMKEAPAYVHKGEKRTGLPSWRLRVSLPAGMSLFLLSRKEKALKRRTKYQPLRSIESITEGAHHRCVCIAVEHPSRLYVTNGAVVTHNTYMDLAAAIATGRDPAILCPTVGAAGWQRACDHFGISPHFISTYEAVRGGFRDHIASMDAEGRFTWKHPREIVLILDEAQALRHDDTLTVRCCSAAIRQGISIIVASATIAVDPLEMRFAGRVTGLHAGDSDWHRFLMQHGCYKRGQSFKWDGQAHHLARINARLFPWRGARVRKQDLGEECPETVIETLPMDIPEAASIEQAWRETQEMLDRLAHQISVAELKVKERNAHMKMWQRCEMALVPHLAERIRRDVKEGNSVAVFMNFNASRIALARALNTTAGFYGGQPLAKRQYWEREFQANRQHILVNNIGAGGASVSLHDLTGDRPRIAYILPTDHVIKMEQATGRVDRVGGQSVSRQYIPFVAGSMTERMIERTRRKMANIATINDGYKSQSARF